MTASPAGKLKNMENKQAQAVLFTNISKKDFYHTWNSVTYKFKAGQSQYLEYPLAYHFAKHLTYRELGADKYLEKDAKFQEYINKCISTGEEDEEEIKDETQLKQSILNKNMIKSEEEEFELSQDEVIKPKGNKK